MPLLTAAPLPLLYGCRITQAPVAAACAAVSSDDPSSTTRISRHAAEADNARTTAAMAADSLYAGMTIETDRGSAMTVPVPGRRMAFEFHPTHAIQEILE